MGRVTLGADTLKWNGTLYSTAWRDMQTSSTPFGTSGVPTNLSLCAYLNYNVKPYVVGSRRTVYPGSGPPASPATDFSIGTWVRNRGYGYYFSLINTTNNTIRVDNPDSTPYTSPGYPNTTSLSWPGSGATGVINVLNQVQSDIAAYIRVRSTPSPGYGFTAWYTAPSGGSIITSSSDYNAYYNYATVMSNNKWYARNSLTPTPYWSMTVGKGPSATSACYGPTNTGYTIYFQGTGTQAEFNTHAGPVYRNSAGSLQPTSYLHFVSKVRYWNQSTLNFGSQEFCPGV